MSKQKFYPDTESSPDFPKMEEEVLNFWKNENVFQKSIDNRPATNEGKNNEFIFYDGPPFANGLPHYGHLLTGFVKDIFARYQTIKGKKVERRFGWDCHGLPAEMGAEKELKISGRAQIMEFGVDKFNDHCRKSVLKYTSDWEEYVTRQARWVDFKNDYKTMDLPFMESVCWAFKQLYDKGLIYESMRVMPYSWACETPLSNHETKLDNSYRERADKAVTVGFALKERPEFLPEGYKNYRILAWTTTPWTLPSNLALAVNKDIEYVAIGKGDDCYILAKFAVSNYSKELGTEEALTSFKGEKLVGLNYQPLFPYFASHPNSFVVLDGEFVTEGDGTGIVHLAPGFGEEDQIACQQNGIELVCPVDSGGKFTKEVTDFAGMQVFDAIDEVIKVLKAQGSWLRTEQYLHNYPHCWRTDTPLIYKAVPSWYVEVTKFRDRMVELNQQINWIPNHIRDGLFGNWLANARDWSISRNRFWGTPIPVWKSDDPKYPRVDVYGSIAELEKDFGVKVPDLHKPYIDDLVRPNPDDPTGKSMMRRVPEVFDCWFESGSMPYAQAHYPFENKEWFENHFPADFIVEYVAQSRGWFYTLMVLSTALFDRPPFLNCICHGVILDDKGQKLSKRLMNYANPKELFATYGSDALRFLMSSAAVMRGQELLIDKDGKMVKDVLRLSIKPIWNAYNFFTLYANADGVKAEFSTASQNLMDKYILAKAKEIVTKIEQAMDSFDTPTACKAVEDFFEVLNNWYIRRNRHRFWKTEKDQDKQEAYNSLYTVLNIICRAASPLLPLLLEEIYLGLENGGKKDAVYSVHLADFPDVSSINSAALLVKEMDRVRAVCSTALAIRNNENIRIRQPLQTLTILGSDNEALVSYAELIKDEVNVKEVVLSEEIGDKASLRLQLNFPVLGKRLPTKMKDILAASKQGAWKSTSDGSVELCGEKLLAEEFTLLLEPKDKKNSLGLPTNDALVSLDLNITKELEAEGFARDIVRFVQQARKEADLHVSDRINLTIEVSSQAQESLQQFKDYITEQTLASINFASVGTEKYINEAEIEGEKVKIGFSVIS
jgi:isoleucyl-tRNA synthetase